MIERAILRFCPEKSSVGLYPLLEVLEDSISRCAIESLMRVWLLDEARDLIIRGFARLIREVPSLFSIVHNCKVPC